MKISKNLLHTILLAVTVGTLSACEKNVETKAKKQAEAKNQKAGNGDSTQQASVSCPACGMG